MLLKEDVPFGFCGICKTYHHPHWHRPEWREAMWAEINKAKDEGNAARFDKLRAVVANNPVFRGN